MIPVREALIGGVLPGVIATLALLFAGVAIALRRRPLPPTPATPEKPQAMRPYGAAERGIALLATLLVGAGVVLSMRLLEPYDGWWPIGVNHRTPALVGVGAIAAAFVAAGPARWWFALPLCLVGAAGISYGIREPLPSTDNLPLAITLDALAIGLSAFLVQTLIDRASNAERGLLVRPLPIVALAMALGPAPVAIFYSGINVSARQSGVVQAVLVSAAIVLAIIGNSGGRVALRGIGVLVVMAIGVWMLLSRTAGGKVLLTPWSIGFLLLAAAGAALAALLLPRLKRWWTPALLTLALVGAPVAAAAFAQHQASTSGDDTGGSPADYGY